MAKLVSLKSTAGTGHFYITKKNGRDPDKLLLKKYNPIIRKHVEYKEDKI